MIPVKEAQQIILDNVRLLPTEPVLLAAATGRVLRQEVRADMDMPPFDRARMDGYALRAADTTSLPARLHIVGEVAAGSEFEGSISADQAVRIMTGAPVPEGADAVQKIEVTEADHETVLIKEAVKPGQFITPRASEAAHGQVLIQPGHRITPADVAVMATFGCAEVTVSRQPLVNVLSTGSELVDVHQVPSAAQIRNSNSYATRGYLDQLGAQSHGLGIVPDDEELTFRRIGAALEQCDALILSGGVSMGDYDLVKHVLRRLGAHILFDRVCLHPGKPTVFATFEDKAIFALPGNPVSVAVTFLAFAFPGLNAMMGAQEKFLPTIIATLERDTTHAPDRRSYLPGELRIRDGRALVTPLKWGGSSDLVAFRRANALIMVPEGVRVIEAGQLCETLLIPQQEVR
ncbi:MAG: molybdopterin molybdotransferase MoeA [Acidobacteria bacterium]|nr:molybdopterin molybdotransferase MoeA [Acidobacteriota bacterium]